MAYDPNKNYQTLIDEAKKKGNTSSLAQLEKERNAKIKGMELPYDLTYNYHSPADVQAEAIAQNLAEQRARGLGGSKSAGGVGNSVAYDYINRQRDLLTQAARGQSDAAIAELDAAAARLPERYAEVKNQAANTAAQNKQAFNIYAATRGLNTGTSGQAELARQNTLGNAYAAADRSMASDLYNIDTEKDKLAAQLAAALANIEANTMSQTVSQMNTDRSFEQGAKQQDFNNTLAVKNLENSLAQQGRSNALADQRLLWESEDRLWATEDRQRNVDLQRAVLLASMGDFSGYQSLYGLSDEETQRLASAYAARNAPSYSGQTFSQIDNAMADIYSLYTDPYTGRLTEAGQQAMYNYATQYGGQYAEQLLTKWGIASAAQPSPTGSNNQPVEPYFQNIQIGSNNQPVNPYFQNILNRLMGYRSNEGRITAIQKEYEAGNISEAEAQMLLEWASGYFS